MLELPTLPAASPTFYERIRSRSYQFSKCCIKCRHFPHPLTFYHKHQSLSGNLILTRNLYPERLWASEILAFRKRRQTFGKSMTDTYTSIYPWPRLRSEGRVLPESFFTDSTFLWFIHALLTAWVAFKAVFLIWRKIREGKKKRWEEWMWIKSGQTRLGCSKTGWMEQPSPALSLDR